VEYPHHLVFRTEARQDHLPWAEAEQDWPDPPQPRVRLEWPAPDDHWPPQRYVLMAQPDEHGCPVYELYHPLVHGSWSDQDAPIVGRGA